MKLLKHAFFLVITLTCFCVSKAQIPSHFLLGEDKLSGIDIYNIIQDKDRNYWLATDNGLIKYDGYTFKNIECENALSSSLFDLQMDYNGDIFCLNLSGQIFKVKNDSCKIYFQIPDSLMTIEISYTFNNLNELIIATNSIFKVGNNKTISTLVPKDSVPNHFYQFITLKDSSIITHNSGNNKLIKIKNNTLEFTQLDFQIGEYNILGVYLNDQLLYIDKGSGNLLKRNANSFKINDAFNPTGNKKESLRYYSDNENLWVAKLSGGVKVFNKKLNPLFNNNAFFQNSIISSFCKDEEGNIILGTFGEGLIIIPNLNIAEVSLPEANVKITRVTSTPNNSIFFGTQDGKIYKKESTSEAQLLRAPSIKNIEVLYYLKESNQLLFEDNGPILMDLSTNKETKPILDGAIKDVKRIENNLYLIATNKGLLYFTPISQNIDSKQIPLSKKFSGRTNCSNIDYKTKSIYMGSAKGLKIGNTKKAIYFKINESSIICRDILYHNEKIYVATLKNGVLIFQNDKLIDHWTSPDKIISNSIKQIKVYKNQFFISTNLGIQIINEKGTSIHILNKSEGLYTNNIIDFDISNDILWMVHQKGIQRLNLSKIDTFNYIPTITLSKTLVNDTGVIFFDNMNLHYNQNKLEFIVSTNSIKFQSEIKYYYQLEGLDEDWQINDYLNYRINYKSLPPGKYTFKIKAVCRLNESKTLSYPFVIKNPLWNTWWFYVLTVFIIITITYLFFNQQIKKHKKKIQLQNELNASKLIAVQSQMNPHFIFNAINSIQDLILKGDIDNSYSYIIKFSKLVRQTLNFSDKEFIDIEDEIELLETYLELEKLRFKDDFEYTIRNEESDLQVPPMLVQPFVENAIKHGLLHKEGLKKLEIVFKKNGILNCTITDNGIGRRKAQKIKDRQQKNHQSFSINATRSRFEIMKSHYQQDLGILFEDLLENGEDMGTRVIINMPFRQNY